MAAPRVLIGASRQSSAPSGGSPTSTSRGRCFVSQQQGGIRAPTWRAAWAASDSIRARSEGSWNIDLWPVITPQSDAAEAAGDVNSRSAGPSSWPDSRYGAPPWLVRMRNAGISRDSPCVSCTNPRYPGLVPSPIVGEKWGSSAAGPGTLVYHLDQTFKSTYRTPLVRTP